LKEVGICGGSMKNWYRIERNMKQDERNFNGKYVFLHKIIISYGIVFLQRERFNANNHKNE